jgi:prepilin-type N-terminal cleavage/methylation domain-containing protein/prepilin-type processing-associated H-X9-DG protein
MNKIRCAIVGMRQLQPDWMPEILNISHEQGKGARCDPTVACSSSVDRKRTAFTLVELLVVIAIVAILAAILIPLLQSGIQASQGTKCIQGQRQLYTALMTYASDNNGNLPPSSAPSAPPASGSLIWLNFMMSSLRLNRANGEAMDCPANKREPYSTVATSFSPKQAYNAAVGASGVNAKLLQWSSPKIVLIADVAGMSTNANARNNYSFRYNATTPSSVQSINPKSFWMMDFTLHQGRANLTFGDGHAKTMRPEDIYAGAKANPPTILFQPE